MSKYFNNDDLIIKINGHIDSLYETTAKSAAPFKTSNRDAMKLLELRMFAAVLKDRLDLVNARNQENYDRAERLERRVEFLESKLEAVNAAVLRKAES